MTYDQLKDFIDNKMRLSHVYQPAMLLALLENRGVCHQSDIAAAILHHDLSQIDYYTKITNNMVGKVLRKHGIVEKEGQTYSIPDFEQLTPIQVEKLKLACQTKLVEFIEGRGDSVWSHRRKSSGYISGSFRYEVLKRAQFHCELCGISAEKRALEVDHIIPRNHGGNDDLSNLQALCYSCNSMKRDTDDTDFRAMNASYSHREKDCIFCHIDRELQQENALAIAIRDGFPVTEGHTLIIPKRHVATYFDLSQPEVNAINQLLQEEKAALEASDSSITGFNIGMNCGEDAGQTVFHCHVHLIPRRKRDVENARGGVRHTIPNKGFY